MSDRATASAADKRGWLPHPLLSASLVLVWLLLQNSLDLGNLLLGLVLGLGIPLWTSGLWPKRLRVKTPSVNQLLGKLSGGNQQKVVIAKWLVRDCDVLIFDEPTRGIDVGAKEEIYELLETLSAQGKAINARPGSNA